MKPNTRMIETMTSAADRYHHDYWGSPAETYVTERGLADVASQLRFGYVDDPAPGHEERFRGMLSIPYLTPSGVVGFKFRAIKEADKKYLIPTGQKTHLYNVSAILKAVNEVLVVEGELDAASAISAGYPAVAISGAQAFKPHFARCFDGIGRVIVITDNDRRADGTNPGQDLARKICDALPNAIRVSLALGEDINSTIIKYGRNHFTELVKSLNSEAEDEFPF